MSVHIDFGSSTADCDECGWASQRITPRRENLCPHVRELLSLREQTGGDFRITFGSETAEAR